MPTTNLSTCLLGFHPCMGHVIHKETTGNVSNIGPEWALSPLTKTIAWSLAVIDPRRKSRAPMTEGERRKQDGAAPCYREDILDGTCIPAKTFTALHLFLVLRFNSTSVLPVAEKAMLFTSSTVRHPSWNG